MPVERRSCVLLADRNHELTEGLRGMLGTLFETVVMVADSGSLLEGARRLEPDVAVVDLSLVARTNLRWLRQLRDQQPDLIVVAISVHSEAAAREAALAAGAEVFVPKAAISSDLLPAIEAVMAKRRRGH